MAIVGASAIVGCRLFRNDPDIVPYDLTLWRSSTCSLAPVEVSLYQYVGTPGEIEHTPRVTREPPLRFVFPKAYFVYESNQRGGPQAFVELQFGRHTLKPSIYAEQGVCPPRWTNAVRPEFLVEIYSNVLGNQAMVNPEHRMLQDQELRPGGRAKITQLPLGTVFGCSPSRKTTANPCGHIA